MADNNHNSSASAASASTGAHRHNSSSHAARVHARPLSLSSSQTPLMKFIERNSFVPPNTLNNNKHTTSHSHSTRSTTDFSLKFRDRFAYRTWLKQRRKQLFETSANAPRNTYIPARPLSAILRGGASGNAKGGIAFGTDQGARIDAEVKRRLERANDVHETIKALPPLAERVSAAVHDVNLEKSLVRRDESVARAASRGSSRVLVAGQTMARNDRRVHSALSDLTRQSERLKKWENAMRTSRTMYL